MHAGPVRVLIVDDHQLFADTLKLLLDRDPTVLVVGIAGSGGEAIDLALQHDAQVVLMDLGLPDIDGYEAARRLRALNSASKVIAVSGRDESEVARDVQAAGMVSFLSKNKIGDHVRDAIDRALA